MKSINPDRSYLYGLILAVISLALYGQSLSFPLIWDSRAMVMDNPAIHSVNMREFFRNPTLIAQDEFQKDNFVPLKYYRPVLQTIFALWYKVAGESARLWHALAVAVNCVVVLIVFGLIKAAGKPGWVAFSIALLYAVNPGRVESVAWVYGLSNQFFTLFALIALWAWIKQKRVLSYFFWLACLGTRETGVLFPFIVIAWDVLTRSQLHKKWVLIHVITIAFYLWWRALVTGGMPPVGGMDPVTLLNTVIVTLQKTVYSMTWPMWGVRIYPFEDLSEFTPEVIVSYMLVAAFGFWLLMSFRNRNQWASFWLIWLAIWTALRWNAGNFAEFLMGEKGNDLLAVAYAALLFELIRRLTFSSDKPNRVFLSLVMFISLAHGSLTIWRTAHWQDPEKYYLSALDHAPDFYLLHFNLGMHYVRSKQYAKAEISIEETVKREPKFGSAWNNLGNLKYLRKDLDGAEAAWLQGLEADPGLATAAFNLSVLYSRKGDRHAALIYRQKYNELSQKAE